MAFEFANNHVLIGLAVAFGVGLLIGIEREQRKGADPTHIVAGVRTFALIALAGAVCTLLGTALIGVGAAFVGLAALASYHRSREADPGLTTEIAMFVAFLLGVLAMHQRELAAGIGVAVALILALKSRLHAFTHIAADALDQADRADALLQTEDPSPLCGLPVAVKDLIDVAGQPATSGSRVLAGRIAEADAQAIARLRAQGACPAGLACHACPRPRAPPTPGPAPPAGRRA